MGFRSASNRSGSATLTVPHMLNTGSENVLFSLLGHAARELGHLDLLLGEVSLETGEDDLTLTRLQAVNQAGK